MNKNVVLCLLIFSCTKAHHLEELEIDLMNNAAAKADTVFILNGNTIQNDFTWDEVLILVPYISLDKVESEIGYSTGCISSGIEINDHYITLCFYENQSCLGYIDLNVEKGPILDLMNENNYLLTRKSDLSLPLTVIERVK